MNISKYDSWSYVALVAAVAALEIACPRAKAQDFSVSFRPMPLRASEAMLGSKEYGLWTAEVQWTNPLIAQRQLTRKEILDLAVLDGRPIPFIADEKLATNLIENRVYLSKPSKVARWFAVIDKYAGPALALAGFATGEGVITITGLAYQGVKTGRDLAAAREPKPEDVVRGLMPQTVVLVNGQATHALLSAKMPNARPLLDVRPQTFMPPLLTPTRFEVISVDGVKFESRADLWEMVSNLK